MSNPVGWFEIYVNDMPRAKAFYEAVLDVKLNRLEANELEMWSFPGTHEYYGAPGALVHMPGFPAGANSVLVYFSCTDCAVQAQRAADHGGQVQKPKTAIGPYGFIALVTDTEGNLIGLHSMK
jgi:hypothetical protein